MITALQGMTEEIWITRCAARLMSRVKDFTSEEARGIAEDCFENVNKDLSEHPEDRADEEISCWGD